MTTKKAKKCKKLDKVLKHLFSMKKRCLNDIGVPVYRNNIGETDPIGACLPKSQKEDDLSILTKKYKRLLPTFKDCVIIQLIHDNQFNWTKRGIKTRVKKRLLKMLIAAGYDVELFWRDFK
jgi:hypothetical protein